MSLSQRALFLRRFLPVVLVVVVSTWFYGHEKTGEQLATLKNQEVLNVGLGSASILRHIQSLVGDLRFVADHFALQKLANDPSTPEIGQVEAMFESLAKTKKVYDQIRWINADGHEIVRVDLRDGQPALIPRSQLQYKGDRYYFTEAMQRDAGQIYLSPLDLNIENGNIELPYKPVLRLALPVKDRKGTKQGIVIINYLGNAMLDRLAIDSNAEAHLALVDSAGYWLHSPDPADEWGFMFKDAKRNLGSRFPTSWARMKERQGQFLDENGLWTYQSVYPQQSETQAAPRIAPSLPAEYRWLVVSYLSNEELSALTDSGPRMHWVFAGILILLAGLGIHVLLKTRLRAQESQDRFHAIFDYAMVGIATISPDKTWLSVNPALCRMLGYEAEALMQMNWHELSHPDDLEADKQKMDSVLRGNSDGYAMEKRFIGKDGSIVHTAISARAIRKANGAVDFFVAIVEDISNWVLAESEWSSSVKTLQRFIDHLPGSAYIKAADSRILLANKGFREQFGINPESILGRLSIEAFPGEFGKKIVADEARILTTGITERVEDQWEGRILESTRFAIPREDGSADLGGITIDITERRLTELRLSQQARRSAVLLDLPKKAEELPEKAFMQYALERAEELTQSVIGFMHFVNIDGVTIELVAWSTSTLKNYCTAAFDNHYPISEAGIWANAARQKQPIVINDYATTPNKHGLPPGHSALTRLLSIPVMEEGEVRMMTGVGNKAADYTDFDIETVQLIGSETWRIVRRQRTENALRLAMQVVNASPVVCYRSRTSEGWPLVFISDNVRQWGYSADQLIAGTPAVLDIIHPDDLPRMLDETKRHAATGVSRFAQEYRLITADGQVVWVHGRTTVRQGAEGNPEFFDGVLTDITERKTQQNLMDETLAQQKKLNKRLEDANNQLMQSEKMASIGQLAAGVAHELNNPIGFVHSNLGTLDGYVHDLMGLIAAYETLLCKEGETSPHADEIRRLMEQYDFAFLKEDIFSLLAESKDGLGRVRKIVQDLKNFSRVGEQEWQEADLHQGLDSTLNIVWNELKYKAKVVKDYGEIPHVFCLISQLNQVFMNLLVNAGHAIETQGTITIRTRRHGEDKVCVEISDTGKGIAPEHINRIFEPFFTTKPVGKGTGLGLSLSYGIIKRHGGLIEVESTEGQGTTFRVLIPVNPRQTTETKDSETSS
ncbi:MAG: PAS domain S-box protein [Azonexaceae bacterium]|nr:PAS domain S-box protein [Azonexaceae bacterium]